MVKFNKARHVPYVDALTHIRIYDMVYLLALEQQAMSEVASPYEALLVDSNTTNAVNTQLDKFKSDAGYAFHTMRGMYKGDLEPLMRKAYRCGHATRELRKLYTKSLNMMIQRTHLIAA